jgi:hypothetical protein
VQNQIRYLTITEFQHLVWWSYRDSQLGAAPEAIKDIQQSKFIRGPINTTSPKQVQRLADSSEIVPGTFQGRKPDQICVLVLPSDDDVLGQLAGFEAQLVNPANVLSAEHA